jgi:hypothetical protein
MIIPLSFIGKLLVDLCNDGFKGGQPVLIEVSASGPKSPKALIAKPSGIREAPEGAAGTVISYKKSTPYVIVTNITNISNSTRLIY